MSSRLHSVFVLLAVAISVTAQIPSNILEYKAGYIDFSIPFMVSVQRAHEGNDFIYMCGGSIIHERIVLTAAHCFDDILSPRDLHVVSGIGTNDVQRHSVDEIHRPSRYLPHRIWGDDIACLVLSQPLLLDNKRFQKIAYKSVKDTGPPPANMSLTLIGYNNKPHLYLNFFEVKDFFYCLYDMRFDLLTFTEFCALSVSGRGACDGDSGGPIMDRALTQVYGVLSYGKHICQTGQIFAFTDVNAELDFIDRIVQMVDGRKR